MQLLPCAGWRCRAIIPIPFNSEGSENVNWEDAVRKEEKTPLCFLRRFLDVNDRLSNMRGKLARKGIGYISLSLCARVSQGQTKCCRELHLYIEDGKLCCTGFLRLQNATIFPKNVCNPCTHSIYSSTRSIFNEKIGDWIRSKFRPSVSGY
jgi:hypothetical protein